MSHSVCSIFFVIACANVGPAASSAEPLYDIEIPTPTHAERARTLVSRIPTGTLCTIALEPEGYPYGSFVTVAFDAGNPVFLISGLAEHTKNLERDPRASLLVAESVADDPLANGRVTLLGPCTRVEGDGGSARAAFLTAVRAGGVFLCVSHGTGVFRSVAEERHIPPTP